MPAVLLFAITSWILLLSPFKIRSFTKASLSRISGTITMPPLAAGTQTLSVTFQPADSADYNSATVTTQLTVSQAHPVITWPAPAGISYGTPLSGTQLDATANVSGTFTYAPASGILGAGPHTLSVTFQPDDNIDYSSSSASVTLNVAKARPTIAWSTPAAIAYGTPLSAAQLDATANIAGSFNYAPEAGAVLSAGTHTIAAIFTPTDTTDYFPVATTVTLTVNKATPQITWANPNPIIAGTALSAEQLDATADTGGKFVYAPGKNIVLGAGFGKTLSVNFTPNDRNNYTNASGSVTIDVLAQGASLSPSGVLYVVGNSGANISVQLQKNSVTVDMHDGSPKFQAPLANVHELVVYGRGKNAQISVDPNLLVPAFLFAGNGKNVQIQAGGGPTVEVG